MIVHFLQDREGRIFAMLVFVGGVMGVAEVFRRRNAGGGRYGRGHGGGGGGRWEAGRQAGEAGGGGGGSRGFSSGQACPTTPPDGRERLFTVERAVFCFC